MFLPSRIPIVQAPMEGAQGPALAAAVCRAGGVGSIPAAMLTDGRAIAAAFALGASAVQIGTTYLLEATTSEIHREALRGGSDDGTRLTNLFTGRPARGVLNRFMREMGPTSDLAPPFPLAARAESPLRAVFEKRGSSDFSPLWAGEAAALAREVGAESLTRRAREARTPPGSSMTVRAWSRSRSWSSGLKGSADGREGPASSVLYRSGPPVGVQPAQPAGRRCTR